MSTAAGAAEVDATRATTTITDTGMATVSVAATAASTVTEGQRGGVRGDADEREAATATELSWSTSGGTATSGEDFTAVSSGDGGRFSAGDTNATLTIATINGQCWRKRTRPSR